MKFYAQLLRATLLLFTASIATPGFSGQEEYEIQHYQISNSNGHDMTFYDPIHMYRLHQMVMGLQGVEYMAEFGETIRNRSWIILRVRGVTVGYATYSRINNSAVVSQIVVDRSYQGQGYGAELLFELTKSRVQKIQIPITTPVADAFGKAMGMRKGHGKIVDEAGGREYDYREFSPPRLQEWIQFRKENPFGLLERIGKSPAKRIEHDSEESRRDLVRMLDLKTQLRVKPSTPNSPVRPDLSQRLRNKVEASLESGLMPAAAIATCAALVMFPFSGEGK